MQEDHCFAGTPFSNSSPTLLHSPKFQPRSALSLLLFLILITHNRTGYREKLSYHVVKGQLLADDYPKAKKQLVGENGPFAGWIRSGKEWQNFNYLGELIPGNQE